MIRINFTEEKELTMEEYRLICSVVSGQVKLLQGKKVDHIGKSFRDITMMGALLIVVGLCNTFLLAGDGFFDKLLTGICFVMGGISIATPVIMGAYLKKQYEKSKDLALKGSELLFDEVGISIIQDGNFKFTAPWANYVRCFVVDKHIVITLKNMEQTLYIPATAQIKKDVLKGLQEGGKERLITIVRVEKGKLTAL